MNPAWVQIAERRYMDGDAYAVAFDVQVAYGVPKEVFVFSYGEGVYSHVATVADIGRWPASAEEAREGDGRFYRLSGCARSFATVTLLSGFIAHVKSRLTELTNAWDTNDVLDLPNDSVYVLGGDT